MQRKICRFDGCDTVLTKKTAYSNGRGGLRNECKEHHKSYRKPKVKVFGGAAHPGPNGKEVVKEVKAPKIESELQKMAGSIPFDFTKIIESVERMSDKIKNEIIKNNKIFEMSDGEKTIKVSLRDIEQIMQKKTDKLLFFRRMYRFFLATTLALIIFGTTGVALFLKFYK